MYSLQSLSPLDGRYFEEVKILCEYFSEMALMHHRLQVEVEYFIALSLEKKVREFPPLSQKNQKILRSLYKNFSLTHAEEIKKIEKITNHDVKAVEYFLQQKLEKTPLKKYTSFIHFALTSEDINNIALTLMWKSALKKVYLPLLQNLMNEIKNFSDQYKKTPLLGMTHGQPATPTTVGKEFFVFFKRLERQFEQLKNQKFLAKLNGATGTWGAHVIAYGEISWKNFSSNFISSLGLEPNLFTTQIESHDSLLESFHTLHRINSILLDFSRDLWLYISRGIFSQQKKENEIGSSTMPHKVHPIYFENAEGNLGTANSYFSHFADKLPVSRMQRDLSDSTVMRNIGVPLAHSVLSCESILKGLSRLGVNKEKLKEELEEHWEVLAEPIQTILRKYGDEKGYEKLKILTRGEKITKEKISEFVETLSIPKEEKKKLQNLTPSTYLGYAEK